jgi:hypothetical protein
VLLLVLASVAAVGGCGAAAGWYAGLFASKGQFRAVDACALMPPPTVLAPLVWNGAREPGSSRPKTLLGRTDGGDLTSECKWSSVPASQDRPFRTVGVHVETKVRNGRTPAEARAAKGLALWRETRSGTPTRRLDMGEEGYAATDRRAIQIVVFRTVIYDLHVEFRLSNAVVDVSARTHTEPGEREQALVLGLAEDVARRLDRTG